MARLAAPRAVRFVRSDGGGEFGSLEAQAWYRETGIQHQVSPPYTPELNGVIERFMRTAKEMITAMLKGSALPHEYWAHAARHAACIIMKTTKVQGKTAWERLTGREPTLPTSRVFGQSITVAIPRAVRTKGSLTNTRGARGTLLGQRWDRVGWIVELEDGKVIETREVSKTKTSISDSGISGEWRRTALPRHHSRTPWIYLAALLTNDPDDGSVGDEGDEGNGEEQDGTQEYVPSEASLDRPPPPITQPTAFLPAFDPATPTRCVRRRRSATPSRSKSCQHARAADAPVTVARRIGSIGKVPKRKSTT